MLTPIWQEESDNIFANPNSLIKIQNIQNLKRIVPVLKLCPYCFNTYRNVERNWPCYPDTEVTPSKWHTVWMCWELKSCPFSAWAAWLTSVSVSHQLGVGFHLFLPFCLCFKISFQKLSCIKSVLCWECEAELMCLYLSMRNIYRNNIVEHLINVRSICFPGIFVICMCWGVSKHLKRF